MRSRLILFSCVVVGAWLWGCSLDLQPEPRILYQKWGGIQTAKKGDWLLNNDGDCYTVDKESFAATYTEVSPGQFCKTGFVWATVATAAGSIQTKEGESTYEEGDYIVFNNPNEGDGYRVRPDKFHDMYEEVEPE